MGSRLLALTVFLVALGCGGLGVPDVPTVKNGVRPPSITMGTGQTAQFQFFKNGIQEDHVVWGCSDGSISSDGKYTAPSAAGIYQISAVHNSSSGEATVVVG